MSTETLSATALPGPPQSGRGFIAAAIRPLRTDIAPLVAVAAPLAGVGLLNMAVSITDTAVIASLGADALATGAVLGDAQSIVFYFVGGGLSAIAPMVAAARAGRDPAEAPGIIAAGLRLSLVMMVVGALAVVAIPSVLAAVGVPLADRAAADAYAMSLAAATVGGVLIQFARSVLAPLGRSRTLVIVAAAIVPLNAAADLVLAKGLFGCPALGLAGAGYGTAIAYGIAATVLTGLALREGGARLSQRGAPMSGVLVATLVTAFAMACETGVFLASTLAIGALDPSATARHVIAFRVIAVCYCIVVGAGQAVSLSIAAARARSPHSGPALGVPLAFAAMLALGGAAAATALVPWLLGALGSEAGAATWSLTAMAAATTAAMGFAVVGLNALRGAGLVRASAIAAAIGYWGTGAGSFAAALALGQEPLAAIWQGLCLGSATAAMLSWAMLGRTRKPVGRLLPA